MFVAKNMIGAPVYDRDGHQIGTVKEVEGSALKIDVPLAFDYWLHFDAVESASLERVVLQVGSDYLDEFKLDSPEDAGPYVSDGTLGTREGRDIEADRVRDRTMVGEVVTGLPPEERVIVRGGHDSMSGVVPTVDSEVGRDDEVAVTGVTDWGDVSSRFRTDWQSHHDSGTWEELEPGYHFGYEMAHDPRYLGRSWDDVEGELRNTWIEWSGRSGSRSDHSSWERVRPSAHHAWESARTERHAA